MLSEKLLGHKVDEMMSRLNGRDVNALLDNPEVQVALAKDGRLAGLLAALGGDDSPKKD